MPSGRSPAPCARIAMSWMVTDLAGSPATWNNALVPNKIGHRHLEHGGGDEPGLVPHLASDQGRRGSGHRGGAAAVRAEAERRLVRVAVHDLDVRGRDADLLGHDLGEGRLVALPLGLARHPQHRRAGGVDAQFRAVGHAEAEDVHVLAWSGADRLGEEGDADSHQLAARTPVLLLAAQGVVVRDPQALHAASARSCPSRRPGRSWSCTGTVRAAAGSAAAAPPGPSPPRAPSSRPGARPGTRPQ